MFRDAVNLTNVTFKRFRFRKGGLIYSQFYNSVKEIFDAVKCYPFQNDYIKKMALDP
jgi:hypothetical protein